MSEILERFSVWTGPGTARYYADTLRSAGAHVDAVEGGRIYFWWPADEGGSPKESWGAPSFLLRNAHIVRHRGRGLARRTAAHPNPPRRSAHVPASAVVGRKGLSNTQIALIALGVAGVAGAVWYLSRRSASYYPFQLPAGFTTQRNSSGGATVLDPSGNLFATVDQNGFMTDSAGNRITHTAGGTTVPVRLV